MTFQSVCSVQTAWSPCIHHLEVDVTLYSCMIESPSLHSHLFPSSVHWFRRNIWSISLLRTTKYSRWTIDQPIKQRSFFSDSVLCVSIFHKGRHPSFFSFSIERNRSLHWTNSPMFAAFRRRAASATRSESSVKEGPLVDTNGRKANAENQGFITPTLPTNGNGLKHRTLSGLSVSSSSSLSTSPMLNITRQHEKQELQTLNDRLAVIIDTVRRLEQDNEKLRVSEEKQKRILLNQLLVPCRTWSKAMLSLLKQKHRKWKPCMKMN